MNLLTKIFKRKQCKKVNKNSIGLTEEEKLRFRMHMLYRDGEADAEYEIEYDDYAETKPCEIANNEKSKEVEIKA